MKQVDDELIDFVTCLIASIPLRRLKDKDLHIISPKTKKDMGTLKEYIVERAKALLGVDIVFDF